VNAPLPGMLADNPALDRWVAFPAPGKVAIGTGRVEFGQGVLTAVAQLAADELDVRIDRISVRSGDTALTPNEGYTAGSMSMQAGAAHRPPGQGVRRCRLYPRPAARGNAARARGAAARSRRQH
jgi:nicotinate dehydrogenase subunit B